MIRIGRPYIKKSLEGVFLNCDVLDESQGINKTIWYKTNHEYGKYLCDDVADAFVVAMLLPAIYYGEDITVEALISERLYYNIKNSLVFTLSHVWKRKRLINVDVQGAICTNYNSSGVGCGCSLGVDSFAAIIQHCSDECPNSYKITHLTYFNVGAMGYRDLNKAKGSFDKDLEMVREYADQHSLPVVTLESNLSLVYQDFDFDQSGLFRNMSAVLSLQKLFSKYLYASSVPISDFQLSAADPGYMEPMLLPLLSTESTELVEANPDMSRVDKIKMIIDNNDVKKTLYVCWKELLANKHPNSEIAQIKDCFLNCSRCEKCLRTLAAIDLLGKLEDYRSIFDVDYYKSVKDSFFAQVIYLKNKNVLYFDLCNLMKETHYKPSFKTTIYLLLFKAKIIGAMYRIRSLFRKI